jgi:hypothetical protein
MIDVTMGVPVTLGDGKERHLYFSSRDVREVWALDKKENMDGLDQFAQILFIGLRRGDPSLTVDEIIDLVPMNQVSAIREKISEAMGSKPTGVAEDVTVPLANSDQTSQK